MLGRRLLNLLNHSIFRRSVGFLSSVVGLVCYALSSSFRSLCGEWNPPKIILYIFLSSVISVVVLFADKSRVSSVFKLKAHVEFLVLMLTSLYSFFADQSTKGKPDTLSVVSSGAFALTSLCLSRQIELGFEVGLFSFFLGFLTVQLMKIHLIFIFVAAGFCYPLVVFRSYSDSQSEIGDSIAQGNVVIRIDNANRANEGTNEQRSSSIVAYQGRSSSGEEGQNPEEDRDLKWLQSFLLQINIPRIWTHVFQPDQQFRSLRRLYGKVQNVWVRIGKIVKGNELSASIVEGNRDEEENRSMHDNPNHLSSDELMAYYKDEIVKMKRSHELQVQELTEQVFTLKRDALLRKRASTVNQDK